MNETQRTSDKSDKKAHPIYLLAYNVVCLIGPIYWFINGYDASTEIPSVKMVLFSSLLGASGGAIHGLASVAWHTGKGTYDSKWTMFYLAQPFLGAGIAITIVLVLQSGIGGFNVQNNLALLAWAALAGLFSQPALDKLRDLFAAIFKTEPKPNGQAG